MYKAEHTDEYIWGGGGGTTYSTSSSFILTLDYIRFYRLPVASVYVTQLS